MYTHTHICKGTTLFYKKSLTFGTQVAKCCSGERTPTQNKSEQASLSMTPCCMSSTVPHLEPHTEKNIMELLHGAAAELRHSTVCGQDGRPLDKNMACYVQLVLTQDLFCCEFTLVDRSCQEGLSVAPPAEPSDSVEGRVLQRNDYSSKEPGNVGWPWRGVRELENSKGATQGKNSLSD